MFEGAHGQKCEILTTVAPGETAAPVPKTGRQIQTEEAGGSPGEGGHPRGAFVVEKHCSSRVALQSPSPQHNCIWFAGIDPLCVCS